MSAPSITESRRVGAGAACPAPMARADGGHLDTLMFRPSRFAVVSPIAAEDDGRRRGPGHVGDTNAADADSVVARGLREQHPGCSVVMGSLSSSRFSVRSPMNEAVGGPFVVLSELTC